MNLDSIGGLLIGIALCLAAIAIPLAIYETQVAKAAIAAGLVQGTIPGRNGIYWVKPMPSIEISIPTERNP